MFISHILTPRLFIHFLLILRLLTLRPPVPPLIVHRPFTPHLFTPMNSMSIRPTLTILDIIQLFIRTVPILSTSLSPVTQGSWRPIISQPGRTFPVDPQCSRCLAPVTRSPLQVASLSRAPGPLPIHSPANFANRFPRRISPIHKVAPLSPPTWYPTPRAL